MSFTKWLRHQVDRLESEIRAHKVFEQQNPPTRDQVSELRRKVAVHRFLVQEIERREARKTQEVFAGDQIRVA